MSAQAHRDVDQALDDDYNARWDRDIKRQLAAIRADEIVRDLGRLRREWCAYQRRYPQPPAGQLDMFTNT